MAETQFDGAADENRWHEAVDKALKGAPRDRLTSRTEDGVAVEPLYARRSDVLPQSARRAGEPWRVIQRVDHPDVAVANELLLADLEGGADGLDLVLASSSHAHGFGVAGQDVAAFDRLFDGVMLDLIEIRLDGGYETSSALALLVAHAERRGYDPAKLRIVSNSDYIGKLVHTGVLRSGIDMLQRRMLDLVGFCRNRGLTASILNADGRLWHHRGATQAQELALTMATVVTYLRDLEAAGIDHADLPGLIGLTLVADADQFGTIAKARAARRLWAAVLQAAGLPDVPARLHMETSWRMMSRVDPYVNMLRASVAAFAAGVGGADSVTVLPFTQALGLPDAFARRVARNTQTILIEESNLHRVADPGAGSGAIEARTEELAAAAWSLFQTVEAEGGLIAALKSGLPQRAISEARAARDKRIATRRMPITGVSTFPNITEAPVRVLAVEADDVFPAFRHIDLPVPGQGELLGAVTEALKKGASLIDITASRPPVEPLRIATLPVYRIAEPYEKLREAAAVADPSKASVFLAALGPLAQFTARATWTKNVFEAGGLRTPGGDEVEDIQALVTAFRTSGARIACLVSSDRIYAESAVEAASLLKDAGAETLLLAGKPGELEASLRAAGVTTFLYEGCDVLDLLKDIHARLGLGLAAPEAGESLS
ncbi:methylmalonyl-CoA mutase family protein [Pannonibacter sp. SL95]|uniref:methylmalonyl-CoA mutase family protein n=1 Tax=Pannonibacter sp. SL95 TaxID=2995153 RepID=UPI0022758615|nr:methylmalonyl-CoA mutase family protein [Pannonibacter sp. SL95]MCY1708527.1 methylmalonyl-CoA mutase family protein [Pannonibacter sp. SL95]